MENHIEQRFVHPDATVVFDIAKLAKSVHEEADPRASSADHPASVSWVILGINDSGITGFPYSAINMRILAKRFRLS